MQYRHKKEHSCILKYSNSELYSFLIYLLYEIIIYNVYPDDPIHAYAVTSESKTLLFFVPICKELLHLFHKYTSLKLYK